MRRETTILSARSGWKRVPATLFLGVAAYLFLRSYVPRTPRFVHAAGLHLETLDGAAVPDSTFAGKPLVLNFWAPWCPPCRQEIPWLEHLQQSHPGVAILGIEDDERALEQARQLARQKAIGYALVQSNGYTRQLFGKVPSLPTTLYISRSGRIVHTVSGVVPETVMRHYLEDTVAAP